MATLARASIEIDNPSIGGRNLWPCSKEFLNKILSDRRVDLNPSYATGGGYKGFTSRKVTASSSSYLNLVELSMSSGTFEYGDLFTLSFYAKGSGTFECYFYGERGYVKTAVVSCSPTSAYKLNYYGDGCYRHNVPSAWTKFVVTWKLDTTGDLTKRKVVLFRVFTGSTLEVCGIKFERGSKATDWTPAPEDVDSAISDLEDKTILNATSLEQRLSSQILQTQEQIQQTVTEQYFTKDETNKLIQQVSTAFTQTAEGWQMDFNKIVSIVNANQAATDSEFQEWSKYIRFVDGNIILGAVANPVVLTIKNDRISFAQSGQEVAYLSNAELVITDARITHGLIIGKFGFIPRANGSLDFKKVL